MTEKNGSPQARQTLSPALKGLMRLYHETDESGVGGILHIWVSDGNYERVYLAWLAGEARHGRSWQHEEQPENTRLGAYIARIAALYLTDTQRWKLPEVTRRG